MSDNDESRQPVDTGGAIPGRIGPYRILDLLGEGGMAEVYLAEQTEPVRRRVALKILKAGMDSKQVVARFESERQALAVLDHPNIARIFDGGVADNGRPYFVMERVKGIPITAYCDDQRMGTRDRIRLFVDVCSAVQHAHLKGLIHRDLKPSNILVAFVDGNPQPKIIDFGIAKATSTTPNDATLHTKVGQVVGTPQYMSPEQAGATGLDVDMRTDVYSLGVVLYELLTGSVPVDLAGVGDGAMQAALREKDAPRPSIRLAELGDTGVEIAKVRGTDAGELSRQLEGDLDWVVMKAIEKDRTRRYETVNALAMDCRRYLRQEPVLARPPSAGYLLRRFAQRNRLVVAAGTVATLAIVAGGAAATVGYLRALQAEHAARQEAETARQVSGFLLDLFEVSDPSEARGNSITAREVLDRGVDRIEAELGDQPAIQATMMETLGSVYLSLGLYDDAGRLLDSSLTRRVELYGGEHPLVAQSRRRLAQQRTALADFDAAESLLEDAYRIQSGDLEPDDEELLWTVYSLAELRSLQARFSEAEQYYRQVIDTMRSAGAGPDLFLARNLQGLAMTRWDQGDLAAAEALLRDALAMQHQALAGSAHPDLDDTLNDLGVLLYENGFGTEADSLFRESLAMKRQLVGDDHPEIATTLNNIAFNLQDSGAFEEAEAMNLEALEIRQRILGADHPDVAQSLNNLALLYNEMGQTERAIDMSRQALSVYRQAFPDGHPELVYGLQNLAGLLARTGNQTEAEAMLTEALDMAESYFGNDHAELANTRVILAELLLGTGRTERALGLAAAAHAALSAALGDSHWRTANALSVQGAALLQLGRAGEAEAMLVAADAVLANSSEASSRIKAASRERMALLSGALGYEGPQAGSRAE